MRCNCSRKLFNNCVCLIKEYEEEIIDYEEYCCFCCTLTKINKIYSFQKLKDNISEFILLLNKNKEVEKILINYLKNIFNDFKITLKKFEKLTSIDYSSLIKKKSIKHNIFQLLDNKEKDKLEILVILISLSIECLEKVWALTVYFKENKEEYILKIKYWISKIEEISKETLKIKRRMSFFNDDINLESLKTRMRDFYKLYKRIMLIK